MVGQRIGSTVTLSRKKKHVCVCMYFWRWVSPFLGNSCAVACTLTEKPVEGNDTSIQPKKWEELLWKISNLVSMLHGWEHVNKLWVWLWAGQWVLAAGMWLDITPHTHITFSSWDYMCCVASLLSHNSLKTYNFQYSATTQHYSECTTEQLNLQEETRVLIQLCTCAQHTNYSVLHNTT